MRIHTILLALTLSSGAFLSGQTHTHGSMVGDLKPSSVIVWTRASHAALVSVRFGTDPTLVNATETTPALVTSLTDLTSKTKLTGLRPATRYYYATRLTNPLNPSSQVLGPIGRFSTAPLQAQDVPVTFLFGADVKVTHLAEYTMFDRMRSHTDAEFYVSMGDMPYADGAVSTDDYRAKHKAVRNSSKWVEFIRQFPVEATVDDHEVVNNWDANTSQSLVATGVGVFKEYYPLPKGSQEIYRSIPWGKALEIFMLDTRSYRGVNGSPTVPGKTMLGAAQKRWLLQALGNSQATFKVVVTSVPLRHGSASDTWVGHGRERNEIFASIHRAGIRNVVFVTGDNHIAAVHHHREGFREVMVGPIAQFIGAGNPSDPEMRWRARQLNYGLIRVDPVASPPKLTVEVHGASGLLRRETILAEEPARVRFAGDEVDGGYRLQGPAFYRNRGSHAGLDAVEAGLYRISFDPKTELKDAPAAVDLTIPGGSEVSLAANWRDVQTATILFADDFEAPLSGYTVIDETTMSGPSAWFTDQGYLVQSSNINGSGTVARPGTILWTGDKTWTDYTTSVRVRPRDNDAVGVVFRFVDKNNFYRFSMDSERTYRRLVRNVGGTFQVLAEDNIRYDPHNWYDIQVVAVGDRLQVFVGSDKLFDVRDNSHSKGAVGLYTWGSIVTFFEDLVITKGNTAGALPTAVIQRDEFSDGQLTGWTIEDHTAQSAPSAWSEALGVMRQTSNIGASITTATEISRPGTVAALRATVLTDFRYSVRMMSRDNDGIGVVFRYRDAANHYRFAWDSQRHLRRLTKVVGGKWSVLYEDNNSYTPGQWYRVRCECVGTKILLHVDDELVAEVTDASLANGYAGVYCWASDDASFDSFLVRSVLPERAVMTAVTSGRVSTIYGRAPASASRLYGLAMSFGRSPGVPLRWLDPTDPRTLDLTPDFLFFESLKPSPLWPGFFGRVTPAGDVHARVLWPNIPALRGTEMFVGGWTGDVTQKKVKELLPTIAIIYP